MCWPRRVRDAGADEDYPHEYVPGELLRPGQRGANTVAEHDLRKRRQYGERDPDPDHDFRGRIESGAETLEGAGEPAGSRAPRRRSSNVGHEPSLRTVSIKSLPTRSW